MRPWAVGLLGWLGANGLLVVILVAAGITREDRERARARYIDAEAQAFANEVDRWDREHAP